MKRRDLIAELERIGCVLLRNGSRHDSRPVLFEDPLGAMASHFNALASHSQLERGRVSAPWMSGERC